MKNKKTLFRLFGALLVFTVIVFSFSMVQAAAGDGVTIPTDTGLSSKTIEEILKNLLTWLLEIVGIIALIGFIISGIMYLVSTGNEEMVTKAKKYMLYCMIGITVALASFIVVKTIDTILKGEISSSSGTS